MNGDTSMRWRVVRESTPAQRRASDNRMRSRVVVRCVCGEERVLWLEDVQQRRSTGCKSRRCKARHEVAEELRARDFGSVVDVYAFIDQWVREGRERDAALPDDFPQREV